MTPGADISGLATVLQQQINEHFSTVEQNVLYSSSTILDPRFKKIVFSNMEALASAEHNLTEEMMSHADPKEQSNDSDQAEASKENIAQV